MLDSLWLQIEEPSLGKSRGDILIGRCSTPSVDPSTDVVMTWHIEEIRMRGVATIDLEREQGGVL